MIHRRIVFRTDSCAPAFAHPVLGPRSRSQLRLLAGVPSAGLALSAARSRGLCHAAGSLGLQTLPQSSAVSVVGVRAGRGCHLF